MLAKTPQPGRVKTRMSPPLTPEQCAELHEAMMRDVLELGGAAAHRLAFRAGSDHPIWREAERAGWSIHDQQGAHLGERMQQAVDVGLDRAERVVIVGSDSPHLTNHEIDEAAAALSEVDACVAPAEDGGYRMIAVRSRCAPLFARLPWGSDEVLAATRDAARSHGLSLRELAPGFDLDNVADLVRLRLHSGSGSGRDGAAHTRAAIEALVPTNPLPTGSP